MCNAKNNDDNNVWECFTLSNGDEHVFCDECKDNCYYETCNQCCVLMGDKLFDEEEEHDEFPDRLAGYDHNGEWCCAKHREPRFDQQTFYLLDIIINRNNGQMPNWISLKDVNGKLWTSKNDAWE